MLRAVFIFCLLQYTHDLTAQQKQFVVSETASTNSFPVFTTSTISSICIDNNDAKVVSIAADAFAKDAELVSGKQMQVSNSIQPGTVSIIAGTIGKSKFIDEMIKQKQLDVSSVKNKWESFIIKAIDKNKLVIAGSDRRGTAYGIFHLSRLMDVSPFVWWADVLPVKKKQLYVSGSYISKEPSVQYRGIFINDEDWGLQPWAAKNMDTDIKDIGPKTYAKVFELLLRLKANYIWPAMHPCTKAFYYYKENPKVADDYAIIVGSSHAEPMLRNNVFEWAVNFENEYGKKSGEWRYDTNKDIVYNYWNDRVKQATNFESVFTVGMRGVHDSGMPGPKDADEKLKLLEQIITDQRQMLQNNFKKQPDKVPQIFVPYKEVLSLYRRGMKLPDDITIIWPDDNHGYIRQLPNEAEQKRSGGHGVYYHLSYWGSPADYLWLSSMSPALIGYEMKKAYDYNAKKLWVFNVGDIKPAELEMQFALDMAWDITTYNATNPDVYIHKWATETFGSKPAADIVRIKKQYYQLAASGKPEHLNMLKFTAKEIYQRLEAYQNLYEMTDSCAGKIDKDLTDAFFQLVKYPVEAAVLQNKKILYQQLAVQLFRRNKIDEVKENLQLAQQAYQIIPEITERYNRFIAKGKWNGIMSWHPRDQKTFDAPPVFDSLKITVDSTLMKKEIKEAQRVQIITAQQVYNTKATTGCLLLPGSGISNAGLVPSVNAAKSVIQYKTTLNAGVYNIIVKCLPTFAMENEQKLNYSVSLNNDAIQTVNVNAEADSPVWKENVLRGFSIGETVHMLSTSGTATITIQLLNKNIIINQVEIYKVQ
ncbi:MAG: hypothetical protein E6H07_01020 [Bacteroidetes bacterium]|nr:MAG: hypothetical protein E6H07_01020 [Bacteroidota bacterium]